MVRKGLGFRVVTVCQAYLPLNDDESMPDCDYVIDVMGSS